jgi:hypothetical protein
MEQIHLQIIEVQAQTTPDTLLGAPVTPRPPRSNIADMSSDSGAINTGALTHYMVFEVGTTEGIS